MTLGSESNPNLYCKLDIEVYPIVRAANKDPGEASVVGTRIAEDRYLPEGLEWVELFSESSCRIGVGNSHKALDVGLNVGSLSLFE